ncbi:MAG: hypothetical protein ACUVX9_03065 [Anaerolineae bacterium]
MVTQVGIGVAGAGTIVIIGACQRLVLPDVQGRMRLAAAGSPVPGRMQ